MKHQNILPVAMLVTSVIGLSAPLPAQDKPALKAGNGITLAEFAGYEGWAVIAPSQPEDGLKAILGNLVLVNAFRSGIPGNGKPFPDGSRFAKIEWSRGPNPSLPGAAEVPVTLRNLGFMVKDSKRFPDTGGWGFAEFVLDSASNTWTALGGDDPSFAKAACYQCHTAVPKADWVFTRYARR